VSRVISRTWGGVGSGTSTGTAANYGSVWSGCGGGSYFGPCNLEDHCEAGISTQALWDFVHHKLTAPPLNMDLRSAWLLADRLWYGGITTLGFDMYSCSVPNSNGCAGSHLFQVMLAMDDDDGNLANGTPHAAAIYSALADHNIACGNIGDPGNQNFSSCPTIDVPSLSATGGNNSADLSWDAAAGANRYWVYRNDIGCDAGFAKIAEVSGGTTYTDTNVVNGIAYYYVIHGVAASDACVGPISNCETAIPVPCETPSAPTGLAAVPDGDNRIALSWSGGPIADTYNVYRAVGPCPQSDYQLVAGGIAATSWVDTPVSGQVNYAYVITASDVTAGCESIYSNCDSTTTSGACTQAPSFDGLQTVTNPAISLCSLDLGWDPAVIHCTGPATYDVHRSLDPNFTPGPANQIATGLVATSFTDTGTLVSGESHTYVIRAVDSGNGAGESNTVRVSGVPTGPITVGTWTDNAGDDGDAKLVTESPWSATAGQGVTGAGYQTGHYSSDTCAAATTPIMTLGPNPQLSFWSKYDIESGWDKGLVQISTDGGGTWERVPVNYPGTVNNTNDECNLGTGGFFNGTSTSWNEFAASLATWANQDAQVRFIFSSDVSVVGDGWWVDDIAITDVEVAGSCSSEPPFFADDFESGNVSAWSRVKP
jgi:fibronectin type 3 domain-containing protein